MTRAEHIQWCKDRALKYCDMNEVDNAWGSMVSDLGKHDETKGHLAIELGIMLKMGGNLNSVEKMKEFILGFN